jgi:hypothetical protein
VDSRNFDQELDQVGGTRIWEQKPYRLNPNQLKSKSLLRSILTDTDKGLGREVLYVTAAMIHSILVSASHLGGILDPFFSSH